VFQVATGRKWLGPQRRRQTGVVKKRLSGALKIATQRISMAVGVGISGSNDLRKRRGLRSGGAVPTRRKRAQRRIWRRLVGYRGGDSLGQRNTYVEEEEGEGGHEAGEQVHEGRGRGLGRQRELDAGGCKDLVAAPHSCIDDGATDVRKWEGNAAVGVNFLSLTLISWWRMQFGKCVFKKCSFP
jgi:hypothetical protein